MAAIGPFGGGGGSAFEDGPASQVRSVIVRSGAYVDSITFLYADGSTKVHGGQGGGPPQRLDLNAGEFLAGVEGAYEPYLMYLFFTTSQGRSFGPFGGGGGNGFMLTPIPGYAITSFFGRSGSYVDALGFYIQQVGH
jgi:hypothetical protein